MKNQKINLLLLFSIILFSFEIKSSLAQGEINWANLTPPPCEYDGILWRGDWVGPKTEEICITYNSQQCCFTVVYYDRMWEKQHYPTNDPCF